MLLIILDYLFPIILPTTKSISQSELNIKEYLHYSYIFFLVSLSNYQKDSEFRNILQNDVLLPCFFLLFFLIIFLNSKKIRKLIGKNKIKK